MKLPELDEKYLVDILLELLAIPSPTGFCDDAIKRVEKEFKGDKTVTTSWDLKGSMVADWAGKSDKTKRVITTHLDTLGAVVKQIKPNGRLRLTNLGGVIWNSVENESVTVFANDGRTFRGSLVLIKQSGHTYPKESRELPRTDENMEVRLDEMTFSEKETYDLGIRVGDFVAFDTRTEINNGFIRTRYHDDKACVACVLAAYKAIKKAGLKPSQRTYLHFANYEEVGHGGSRGSLPEDVAEVLAIDMGAMGEAQTTDEFHPSLCIKDASGPYHHGFSNKLRRIAEKHDIPYKTDTFNSYSSDAAAFWRTGGNAAVAIFGPGIDGSHSYERTHITSLVRTTQWLIAYMLD